MTYLQLVNNVLVRLREEEVSTVSEDEFSVLVGKIVNDAKQQVEDAWRWSALQDTISISAVNGTATYSLTGDSNRAIIEDVINTTSAGKLRKMSRQRYRDSIVGGTTLGTPAWYAPAGTDGNGDSQISLLPTPDASYSLTAYVVQREAQLTNDSDTTALPSMPIILLAWAMAARERGEVGGQVASEIFGLAQRSLSDAISYDAAKDDEEIDWSVF